MSLSTILNNSRPNKYPLANVMQSLNHPQIIKNLVFVFSLFSASLFSIKRPMLLIIKIPCLLSNELQNHTNSIKRAVPLFALCLVTQFKLLRDHIQASNTWPKVVKRRLFFQQQSMRVSLKAGCTQTQQTFNPTNCPKWLINILCPFLFWQIQQQRLSSTKGPWGPAIE